MVTTWKNQLAAFILHLWKSCEVFMVYHQILYSSIIKLEIQRIQKFFFFFFREHLLITFCVSVSGSLGIVELNKIYALRKLEICEWATQTNSMIFWNSHSHSYLNYNSGESKLFQITQIIASILHFMVPVDLTTLKHLLGPHVNIPLKNN